MTWIWDKKRIRGINFLVISMGMIFIRNYECVREYRIIRSRFVWSAYFIHIYRLCLLPRFMNACKWNMSLANWVYLHQLTKTVYTMWLILPPFCLKLRLCCRNCFALMDTQTIYYSWNHNLILALYVRIQSVQRVENPSFLSWN